jgi:hypothetical protein
MNELSNYPPGHPNRPCGERFGSVLLKARDVVGRRLPASTEVEADEVATSERRRNR